MERKKERGKGALEEINQAQSMQCLWAMCKVLIILSVQQVADTDSLKKSDKI